MKVVINSNLLLVANGLRSRYNAIWQAFLTGPYQLVLSDKIQLEYKEILQEHAAQGADGTVMQIFAEYT
jgi:hypothetical protein